MPKRRLDRSSLHLVVRAAKSPPARRAGRRRDRGARTRGLTLLELVVAILVLSIAAVGTFRTATRTGRQIGQEAERLLAWTVALNRAEELRLSGTGGFGPLPGDVSNGVWRFEVEVDRKRTAAGLSEATIRVRSPGGPGAVAVTYLPAGGG